MKYTLVILTLLAGACSAAATKPVEPVVAAAPIVVRELTREELVKINHEKAEAAKARRAISKAKFNRLDSFK